MAHSITRWEPFAELADMRSRFDRLLGDLATAAIASGYPLST